MSQAAVKFPCGACHRTYPWKPEWAGKRVKCKCGNVTTVPAASPKAPAPPRPKAPVPPRPMAPAPPQAEAQPPEDDLYGLADEPKAPPPRPRQKPVAVESDVTPVRAKPIGAIAAAVPLGYQSGPTQREKDRFSFKTLVDPKRDIYAPSAMLAAGFLLYLSFYIYRYKIGIGGLVAIGTGATIMTAIETAVLIGFAAMIANPLGISFGGVGTAILKLAAIVVFCDGLTTWVDGLFAQFAGPAARGFLGFGVMGFPVALGTYWVSLIYLFSMDSGDSWMVVVLLSIFYRLLRTLLVVLLLSSILGYGGVSGAAANIPSVSGSPPAGVDPVDQEISDAKDANLLIEAKKYCNDTGRYREAPRIDEFYAAGSPNVWFKVDRDINQHATPDCIIVELPPDKDARAKCFDVVNAIYGGPDKAPPDLNKDTGQHYIFLGLF